MAEAKSKQYSLPEGYRKTLKQGEYAVYQLVDVFYDQSGKFHGRTAGISNQDAILTKDGEILPIAFVEGINADGTPRLGNIWFNVETECQIICLSGAKHAPLYNYLEISNYNESNPDRDTNITPVYRRVDSLNQSKNTRAQRAERTNALKAAIGMSEDEVLNFIDVNKSVVPVKIVSKPDGKKDWDAIRDGLERWAENNPKKFFSLSDTKDPSSSESIEELVKWAKENELVKLDRETKSWYGADGKPFLTVRSITSRIPETELVGHLRSEAGKKLLERLAKAKEQG